MDYMPVIIRNLKQIAEEIGIGVHEGALPEAIRRYNQVLTIYRDREPDNEVWSIVKSIDVESGTQGDLVVACTLLNQIITEQREFKKGPRHIVVSNANQPFELHAKYEGDVIVKPGCKFELHGMLNGNVTLFGNASFECHGKLTGNIEADPEASFEIHGAVCGSITTREPEPDELLLQE